VKPLSYIELYIGQETSNLWPTHSRM